MFKCGNCYEIFDSISDNPHCPYCDDDDCAVLPDDYQHGPLHAQVGDLVRINPYHWHPNFIFPYNINGPDYIYTVTKVCDGGTSLQLDGLSDSWSNRLECLIPVDIDDFEVAADINTLF